MRESSRQSVERNSKILCIEVLVPRTPVREKSGNLFWTLSVYSLENQPVQKNRSLHNSELFHFMVYDWQRTIKNLLEEYQVPYSIIQYFSPENIHADGSQESFPLDDNEERFLSAIRDVSETPEAAAKATLSRERSIEHKLA